MEATSISYNEAMEILVDILVHMHPEAKERFLRQIHSDIKDHYHIERPMFEGCTFEGCNFEMDKAKWEIPRYKFKVGPNGEIGPMEIDKDELLSNEKCDFFLTKQEMEI